MTIPRDLIVVDVISNGQYGQPFCVGAAVMDHGGRVLETLLERSNIDQVVDEYVEIKVLPNISDIEVSCEKLTDLEERFITWFMESTINLGTVPNLITDSSNPASAGFLHGLGARGDRFSETWRRLAPRPTIDVSSILVAIGRDPTIDRNMFAERLIGKSNGNRHSPVWNAEVLGLCFITAMRPSWEGK